MAKMTMMIMMRSRIQCLYNWNAPPSVSFQGLIRANEEFVAEVERLYGEEERWEGRLEDFFGKV